MKETLPIFFRLPVVPEDCWLLSLEPLAPRPASAGAAVVEAMGRGPRGQRCGAAQQRHEDLGEALATSAEAVGGDCCDELKAEKNERNHGKP